MKNMRSVVIFLAIVLLAVLSACQSPPEPTPTPPPLPTATPRPQPEAVIAPPPAITHDLQGRDNCLMCHGIGTVGAIVVPDDHSGWTNAACSRCHTVDVQPIAMSAAVSPPGTPHDLIGRDDCLMCHRLGLGQAPRYPDDHISRTNDVCQGCHQPLRQMGSGEEVYAHVCAACHGANGEGDLGPVLNSKEFLLAYDDSQIRRVVFSGREDSTMLAWGELGLLSSSQIDSVVAYIRSWEATAPSVGEVKRPPTLAGPPAISHDLAGRDNCLMCHEKGVGGSPQIPDNHATYTNDMCSTCHQPAAAPEQGEVEQPPTPAGPPAISHDLAGRDNCLMCHEKGVGGSSQIPDTHATYTNDMCSTCHQPATAPEQAGRDEEEDDDEEDEEEEEKRENPPAISHDLAGRDNCLMCHEKGVGGSSQIPDTHATYTNDMCSACHQPATAPEQDED